MWPKSIAAVMPLAITAAMSLVIAAWIFSASTIAPGGDSRAPSLTLEELRRGMPWQEQAVTVGMQPITAVAAVLHSSSPATAAASTPRLHTACFAPTVHWNGPIADGLVRGFATEAVSFLAGLSTIGTNVSLVSHMVDGAFIAELGSRSVGCTGSL